MLQIDKFLKTIGHRNDIIFTTSFGEGSEIIYIPENNNPFNISTFFNSQKLNNQGNTDSIIVPNRLNISGKTIINNVIYTKMKTLPDLKKFQIFKTVSKLKIKNHSRYIDTSPFIKDIVTLAHTKSVIGVYNEFFKWIFNIYNDLEISNKISKEIRPKILLIDGTGGLRTDTQSSNLGLTEDLDYFFRMNKYILDSKTFETLPDAIIYKIDNLYFQVGKKESPNLSDKKDKENKEEIKTQNESYIKINRMVWTNILKLYNGEIKVKDLDSKIKKEQTDNILGFKNKKDINQILKVGQDINDITSKVNKNGQQEPLKVTSELKKYIEGNPVLSDLEGSTFQEKLQNLYYGMSHAEKIRAQRGIQNIQNPEEEEKLQYEIAKDIKIYQEENKSEILNTKTTELISKLTEQEKLLVKKYNGTVFLDDIKEARSNSFLASGKRLFNPDPIVGLTEFNGYKKQETEFENNLDNAIEDLIKSLEKDKDIGIKVLNIKSEIKDNNKTRFKRFSVQIQHSNFGKTFKGKYSFTLDVPYPADGKYIKFGGNDYVMVNQLFNKPIQKVNNQLVRLYTHYNTTSVTLKSTALNGIYGLQNIEKELVVSLKNLSLKQGYKFEIKEFKDIEQFEYLDFLPRSISSKFKYKIINLNTPSYSWTLDFTKKDSFWKVETNGKIEEYANIDPEKKLIFHYIGGDQKTFPLEHLDGFLLGIFNKLGKNILKRDFIKKSKTSNPYFSVKIIGYQLPVILLVVSQSNFQQTMQRLDLKWTFQDKKIITKESDKNLNSSNGGEPINIQFQNGYLTVYPKSIKQRMLAAGFLKYKVKTYTFDANINSFEESLIKEFGSYSYKKLMETIPKIIDNTTEKILKEYNYPTDVLTLYSDTIPNMMLTREDSHFENLDYYRIRLSETISHIGYNQIQMAISELKRKKEFPDHKLILKPEFIMGKLLEAGLFQNAKTINPIEEMMLSQKIVKTGIGNVKKSQVTLQRRDLNQSYFGVISATATNEYGGIGSNQTLTNGTTIKDRFGSIKTKEYNNEDNPFNMLAPVESLTPFFEYDDTTRRIMGNQQTGQFTQLENPDEPLVQTMFESYVPWLVSDRFTKKAQINGKVTVSKDNPDILIIDGTGPDIGKKQVVSLKHAKSRTKRGVYLLNKYHQLVSDGQNVKPNSVLAATDSLKTGKLAVGKNLVIAEMPYDGMNYEDGWVITSNVQKKYSNKYLQKLTILIPGNVKINKINLEKNKVTKPGEILLEFQKENYYVQNLNLDTENEENLEDVLYGLEQHRGVSKYFSPGGKILEIQVRLNTPKPDVKIKSLYDQSIRDIKMTSNLMASQELGNNKNIPEANIEGLSALSIGGHKIGGEEPETGIIEVFIERENPINNGSKFTLGNSGGKGTVQYIIPEGKEPIAIESQLKIDFVPTSLSIIKRKNPSIIFNMYLGKCMFFINEMSKQMLKEQPENIERIKNFITSCYTLIDKTEGFLILKEIENFFKNDKNQIQKAINQSNSLNRPFFVAVVPPFKNKLAMKDIVKLSKHIGIPLKEKVKIQENDYITLKKVPVGILNVFLLEHFPQTQGSVRGSMYVKRSIVTGQGSSGSKDRKGATKAGLYDLYSILTKRPYNLIKELHSLKSDAKMAKIAYDRQIFEGNGVPSISNIKITKDDTTTKNYIEALFLAAGLKTFY